MDTGAEARVVASFTFIVALLLGVSGGLDQLLAGPSSPIADPELARLAIALLPFAVTGVAYQAAGAAQAAWARTLGGAVGRARARAGAGGSSHDQPEVEAWSDLEAIATGPTPGCHAGEDRRAPGCRRRARTPEPAWPRVYAAMDRLTGAAAGTAGPPPTPRRRRRGT